MRKVSMMNYNQMYAGDGRSLWGNAALHVWHNLGRPDKMLEMADVGRTTELIEKVRPDILTVSEVLGDTQREELVGELEGLDYKHFHYGTGHGWPGSDQRVTNIVASRIPMEPLAIDREFTFSTKPGTGGGMAQVFFPDLNARLLQVHLANQMGAEHMSVLGEQIAEVRSFVRDSIANGQRFLITGDFNMRFPEILERLIPRGADVSKYSSDAPTCSATPVFRWIFNRNIDHAIGHGFNACNAHVIEGHSDHRGVYVELEVA